MNLVLCASLKKQTKISAHSWKPSERKGSQMTLSIFIRPFPAGNSEEGDWEGEGETPRKQCLPVTTGLTHIWPHRDCGGVHRACTGWSQTGSQCWRAPILNGGAISNWHLLAMKSHWIYRWQLRGPVPSNECPTHSELNGIFGDTFVSYCFVWFFPLLLV